MKILSTLILGVFLIAQTFAQSNLKWMAPAFESKRFIENKGQFNGKNQLPNTIEYGVDNLGVQLYFTKQGLTYRIDTAHTIPQNHPDGDEHLPIVQTYSYFWHTEWLNANPNVQILAQQPAQDVFHYAHVNPSQSIYNVPAHQKLVYKDLYPNIDVEYTFHTTQGIKYNIVVYPGGDVSQVKMKHKTSTLSLPSKNAQGDITLQSPWGNFIDHAPLTFYQNNPSQTIASSFMLQGDEVSFQVAPFNTTETLVIDPWTTNPALTTQNKAFDVERDLTGNVFIYGGLGNYKLRKYSAAGAVIWTLNSIYTTAYRYGDLAVDQFGNSYITASFMSTVSQVTPAGVVTYNNSSSGTIEFWGIVSNCTNVYLSRSFSGAFISTLNIGTGAMVGEVNLTPGPLDERAICIAPTGDIYMLLSSTTNNSPLIKVSPAFAVIYNIASGQTSPYNGTTLYANGPAPIIAGYNGIAAGNNFLINTSGATLYKRNLATGALIASIAIPGGAQDANAGVAIDACDNIYVGNNNSVLKYDANLNLLSTTNVANPVYDVKIGLSGEVLASGLNFVSALNLGACNSVICPTLPLPITQLKAKTVHKQVALSWLYPIDQNIAHFNIERSIDGSHFTTIGTVNPSPSTLFTDEHPIFDETMYYRLQWQTKDGQTQYSNVVNALVSNMDKGILKAYPNPTLQGKMFIVEYLSPKEVMLPLIVLDLSGKVVYKSTVYCRDGVTVIETPTESFAKGAYLLSIGKEKYKFVVE